VTRLDSTEEREVEMRVLRRGKGNGLRSLQTLDSHRLTLDQLGFAFFSQCSRSSRPIHFEKKISFKVEIVAKDGGKVVLTRSFVVQQTCGVRRKR